MPRSVSQGFDEFHRRLVPTKTERSQAVSHRATVEAAIKQHLDVAAVWETGSFTHGTGIAGYADVDLLASFTSTKKSQHSSSTLSALKAALQKRYASTDVVVRSPAVVVRFSTGPRVEVIPGFIRSLDGFQGS